MKLAIVFGIVLVLGVLAAGATEAPRVAQWEPTITTTPDWQAIALYNRELVYICWATVEAHETRCPTAYTLYLPLALR